MEIKIVLKGEDAVAPTDHLWGKKKFEEDSIVIGLSPVEKNIGGLVLSFQEIRSLYVKLKNKKEALAEK